MTDLSSLLDRDYMEAGFTALGDSLRGAGDGVTALMVALDLPEEHPAWPHLTDALSWMIAARDNGAQLARYLNMRVPLADTPELADLGRTHNARTGENGRGT